MNSRYFFFILLVITIWLTACGPETEMAAQSPPSTNTAIPVATHEPVSTKPILTVTAVATETATVVKPSATPTAASQPTVEVDPYTWARQILEQAVLSAPEGWQVQPCEGEAAMLCISDGQQNVGFAELILFPVADYAAEHPVRLATDNLPMDGVDYTHEQRTATQQALNALAADYLDTIAADRAITYPDDSFAPLEMESVSMGALPALAYGFTRTNNVGIVQERYLNVAAFDAQFIYLLGMSYDPGNVSGFGSETAVTQFTPFFYDIAARLPIHQPSLPTLPELIPAMSLSGYFPEGIRWSLDTELPEAAAAVAILSQPSQSEPFTTEQAAAFAQSYGFTDPLYVEYRTGFTLDELAAMGMFVAFDEWRSLSLVGRPFTYTDASQYSDKPDISFAQAAPIAEQFLTENRWLTFPYEIAESDQGEGVLFFPILDGVLLTMPAYGVRVTGDGGVSRLSIYSLDDLTPIGSYPIMSAERAWQLAQADPNQSGIFYQIDPPAMETAVSFPPTYHRLPAPSETGSVYNNIWVYRPLVGSGPPLIQSNDYLRIDGDPAMLDALATETDYLVKLTGTIREPLPGVQTLDLTDWELIPDAGGLPIIYGRIVSEEGQIFLDDWANQQTYLLPDAPPELQIGSETAGTKPFEVAVYGLPKEVDGINQIDWQQITILPTAEETILPQPMGPMKAVTVQSVKLIYLRMPAHVSGLADNLYFPVWQFTGVADNGERVTVWVTAVGT